MFDSRIHSFIQFSPKRGSTVQIFKNFVQMMIYDILKFQIRNLSLRAHKSSLGQNFENLEINHLEPLYFYVKLKISSLNRKKNVWCWLKKLVVFAFPNIVNIH